MSAKAGRVIRIPTVTPIIVVRANPLNIPAPAQKSGSIAAIMVRKAPTIMKNKSPSLRKAFEYHDKKREEELKEISKGIRRKGDFHLFHTIEFHAVIGLLGLIWSGFFFIFVGMLFHSLLDVSSLLFAGVFHRREFFFFSWAKKSLNKTHNSFGQEKKSRNPQKY